MTEMGVLRITTFVAAAAGAWCLGLQGQLRMSVVAGAVLLQLFAAASPPLLPSARAARVRRLIANVFVLAICGIEAWSVLSGQTGVDLRDAGALVFRIASIVSLPLVAVLVAQLASADSLRELRMVLVASLLCALLALGTAPESDAKNLWSGLGTCLAVGWAAAVISLWLLQRARSQEAASLVHVGRVFAGGQQVGVLVVGSVLIALASFNFLPHPAGWHPPGWDGESSGPGSNQLYGSNHIAPPREPDDFLSGRLDLNSRGDLPETPLVSVPAQSPELWAGSVLTDYQGRYWTPSRHQSFAAVLPVDSAGDYDLRPGSPPGRAPAEADRTDTVRILDARARLPVIAPGQGLSVHINGQIVRRMATVTTGGSPRPTSYEVRSTGLIRGVSTSEDLALPSSLPPRVGALAREITQDSVTVEAKIAAINRYLRTHEQYRLDSAVPPPGQDAVDDFLFRSHEGFCEHFASAEAVLLRSLGVPTRLVSGFAAGDPAGKERTLRGSDAHAWVQVQVGAGVWVFSDPTAGASLAPERQSWAHVAVVFVRAHWRYIVGPAVAFLLLGPPTVVVLRRIRARRGRRRVLAASAQDQVVLAFARLERVLSYVGLARLPHSSIHELMWSLLTRWPGGLPNPDEVRTAMLVLERVLYDVTPVAEAESLAAVLTLDALAELARTPQLAPASH